VTTDRVSRRLRAAFDDAGAQGWLHVRELSPSGAEVALDADTPVALSSVYKLPLLVAFLRMVDAGEIDPTRRVTVPPAPRTAGSTGLSIMRDPVTMSWRDLAVQMITVSDNAAADVLLHKVGLERVTTTLRTLGLDATTVTRGSAEEIAGLMTETGAHSVADAFEALTDLDHVALPSGYDPLRASASTARDMTTLLAALWTGQAASAEQTAFAKVLLSQRNGPYRLRAGFPHDAIQLADKTGTLGSLRHDVGVVEFPDRTAYAMAVFTRSARPDRLLPGVDAVIGQAARLAVDALRANG
jgi:beta-lactamase class A